MHLNKTAWYFLPALHCVHQALNNDKKNSPGQAFFCSDSVLSKGDAD